jgi:porphobilinogen synthase
MTDVCLCAYTDHGHCGFLGEGKKEGQILNDPTIEYLAKVALTHVEAGADAVSPSDMMDARVREIRGLLDENGYDDRLIVSYTAKYASSYYGPFRDAADSSPKSGDRSSYQMDFRNSKEALKELELDLEEGADMVMVKPALAYLDIVKSLSDQSSVPVVAYNVSGEYASAKLLSKEGFANEEKIVMENLYAIKRAGADIIISYHSREALKNRWI